MNISKSFFTCKDINEYKVVIAFLLGLKIPHFDGKTDVEEIAKSHSCYPNICIDKNTFCGSAGNGNYYYNHFYSIENLSEFLNRLKDSFEVKNVGDYTAIITKNGVKVGCQTISFEKCREIVKMIDKFES